MGLFDPTLNLFARWRLAHQPLLRIQLQHPLVEMSWITPCQFDLRYSYPSSIFEVQSAPSRIIVTSRRKTPVALLVAKKRHLVCNRAKQQIDPFPSRSRIRSCRFPQRSKLESCDVSSYFYNIYAKHTASFPIQIAQYEPESSSADSPFDKTS